MKKLSMSAREIAGSAIIMAAVIAGQIEPRSDGQADAENDQTGA